MGNRGRVAGDGRRRWVSAAVFGGLALSLVLAATALAVVGGLIQKAGIAGCVSETGTAGACVDGRALDGAVSVTISPDGSSAYLASYSSDAVAIFDRNPTTGALTQKAGIAGCISETGTAGDCVDGRALDSPISVAISPDGKSAYVASSTSDAVAIFDRNTTTGALTQKLTTTGCLSETGSGGCTDGTALDGSSSVTISPDGKSVYIASGDSDAVAIFDRNATTGVLTQKAATAGCISETGTAGACVDGRALDGSSSVTISPDGKSAYVASSTSDAVAIFDRNTTTGALTQKAGTAGCISETGTAGACVDGTALDFAISVTISPDGTNAYVASQVSSAVAIFDRNPTTGALTQKAGTAGCISETGTAGACVDGTALNGASTVTAAPDGASVYAASFLVSAVAIFDRNTTTGALTQKAGTAGCISETGTAGACVDGKALNSAASVTISPDGTSAYVASSISDAVAIFDRDIPPQTTIDSGPTGTTVDNTPTFTFSSSEAGSSFECKIDGGTFGACSGPGATHTTFALADGPHQFEVRAIDPATNPDPTPASQALSVDTTPPDTEITKKPKSKLKTKRRTAKAKVTFISEAGATFQCKLDKADYAPCESPFITQAKSKGGKGKKHTISVQATDAAGNVESASATAKFRVIKKG